MKMMMTLMISDDINKDGEDSADDGHATADCNYGGDDDISDDCGDCVRLIIIMK